MCFILKAILLSRLAMITLCADCSSTGSSNIAASYIDRLVFNQLSLGFLKIYEGFWVSSSLDTVVFDGSVCAPEEFKFTV